MRGLLILGCIILGILLVAASHQDQDESEIAKKDERIQEDFVNVREIRSTGGKQKKKLKTPGVFSALSRPSSARDKRSIEESGPSEGNRRRCPGCYSPVFSLKEDARVLVRKPASRQQRDTEEDEKLKKKHKYVKEKSKAKRRRNKNHKDRHANFQHEDPDLGHNNNKRRKHHKGKKDRGLHRGGVFTSLSIAPPEPEKLHVHNGNTKDGGLHRGGVFTALSIAPPEPEKLHVHNGNTKGDVVNDRTIRSTGGKKKKKNGMSSPGVLSAVGELLATPKMMNIEEMASKQGNRRKCPGCYTSMVARDMAV